MSTILKALRRLEDDSNSPRPDSLPATDPAAADELRSRILAEEYAANASVDLRRDLGSSNRMRYAAGLVAALVSSVGLGLYWIAPGDGTTTAVAPEAPVSESPSPSAPVEPVDVRHAKSGTMAEPVRIAASFLTSERTNASELRREPPPTPFVVAPENQASSPSPPMASNQTTERDAAPDSNAAAIVERSGSDAFNPVLASSDSSDAPVPTTSDRPLVSRRPLSAAAGRVEGANAIARPAPTKTEERAGKANAGVSAAKPTLENPNVEQTTSLTRPTISNARREEDRPRAQPRLRAETRVQPRIEPEVEERDLRGVPEVTIERTQWHPDPRRRSARIRVGKTNETMTLEEGDTVGALVVQEITPSAVIFLSGEVEVLRRVGHSGSGD